MRLFYLVLRSQQYLYSYATQNVCMIKISNAQDPAMHPSARQAIHPGRERGSQPKTRPGYGFKLLEQVIARLKQGTEALGPEITAYTLNYTGYSKLDAVVPGFNIISLNISGVRIPFGP